MDCDRYVSLLITPITLITLISRDIQSYLNYLLYTLGETSYGGEITSCFPHFKQHKIDLLNQKIHGITFEDTINALCIKNSGASSTGDFKSAGSDNPESVSVITSEGRKALENTWRDYERRFNELCSEHLFTRDLSNLYERVKLDAKELRRDFTNENIAKVLAGVCTAISLSNR